MNFCLLTHWFFPMATFMFLKFQEEGGRLSDLEGVPSNDTEF